MVESCRFCPTCSVRWLYIVSIGARNHSLRPRRARHAAAGYGTGRQAAVRARSLVHPADGDLRLCRVQLGVAALRPSDARSRLASLRTRGPQGDRAVYPDPVSLYLEIPLVAVARSLWLPPAGPATRLDADHAVRPASSYRSARGDGPGDGHARDRRAGSI